MFWSRHGGRRSGRHYSLAPDADPDVPGSGPPGAGGGVAVAVVIAIAVTLSRHAASMLSEAGSAGHLLGVLLDAMLTVPVAAAAVWLAGRMATSLGVPARGGAARLGLAALTSLAFLPLFTPLAAIMTPLHGWIGVAGGEAHAAHHAAGLDLPALASHGLWNAVAAQPVVL